MSVCSKFFDRIDALEPELVELTHVETKSFDVLPEHSKMTRGPI